MAAKNKLVLENFTSVTDHIDMALERINTICRSSDLSEEQKSEAARLGRSLHQTGDDIDHFCMTLESPPYNLKEKLQEFYRH
ncbi:MAG: hypothetical protein JW883_12150 [Deltaproteobacteria bacterium]|nr:hypothetical protein [Deltaproteobacteria bacterium]